MASCKNRFSILADMESDLEDEMTPVKNIPIDADQTSSRFSCKTSGGLAESCTHDEGCSVSDPPSMDFDAGLPVGVVRSPVGKWADEWDAHPCTDPEGYAREHGSALDDLTQDLSALSQGDNHCSEDEQLEDVPSVYGYDTDDEDKVEEVLRLVAAIQHSPVTCAAEPARGTPAAHVPQCQQLVAVPAAHVVALASAPYGYPAGFHPSVPNCFYWPQETLQDRTVHDGACSAVRPCPPSESPPPPPCWSEGDWQYSILSPSQAMQMHEVAVAHPGPLSESPPPPPCFSEGDFSIPTPSDDMLMLRVKFQLESMMSMHQTQVTKVRSCFHALEEPQIRLQISFSEYFSRFITYCDCSPTCFVLALVYIERAAQRGIPFNNFTCYKLVLTSVTLAIKYLDDDVFTDEFYAAVGGVDIKELYQLQRSFLELLDWKLFVDPEECLVQHPPCTSLAQQQAAAPRASSTETAVSPTLCPPPCDPLESKRVEQNVLEKRDTVEISTAFQSNNRNNKRLLRAGLTGTVQCVDDNGDANIDFGEAGNHWVFKNNFYNLRCFKAQEGDISFTIDSTLYVAEVIEVRTADNALNRRIQYKVGHDGTEWVSVDEDRKLLSGVFGHAAVPYEVSTDVEFDISFTIDSTLYVAEVIDKRTEDNALNGQIRYKGAHTGTEWVSLDRKLLSDLYGHAVPYDVKATCGASQ